MSNNFILAELDDIALDTVLTFTSSKKYAYFDTMIRTFYPKVEKDSEMYNDLLESYLSSFYVEKLYRSNRFFNEKFTPIYTNTGLIRNIVADLYYTEDELRVH